MPVRTSTVVATGMTILTLVGVMTVFGGSIAAVVSPPPEPDQPGAGAPASAPNSDGGVTTAGNGRDS